VRAVHYRTFGAPPEVVTVPDPEPGPGQVVLKVSAAGACHTDLVFMRTPLDRARHTLPLPLGHEGAGTVAALGDGVTGLRIGEAVAVYGAWGCGACVMCAQGKENYCLRAAELGILRPGFGGPGAMAEYMLVDDPRHLLPLGDLDPVTSAPLTDAGLTPYHAIKRVLPKLVPGSTAVVIGVGGLGHLAVEVLRALTSARVIGMDISEDKLSLARAVGAHDALLSDAWAAGRVRQLTGGRGATAVFDFVGEASTLAAAGAMVAVEGDIVIVGAGGGGSLAVGFGTLPFEVSVTVPFWGSRPELIEVLDLAKSGAVQVHVETFSLDDAPKVYELLDAGRINGRAVILPHG
jgi:propanol-preferring alcohol dehydrogenase